MKNKKILLATITLLFLLVALSVTYYNNAQSESSAKLKLANSNIADLEPVEKMLDSLNIMVDPRIELLTSTQLVSGYNILTKLEFDYSNHMKDYFSKNKKHNAVKLSKKLQGHGFNYDAPPTAMLYVTNPPSLEPKIDFEKDTIKRAGSENDLLHFMKELRYYTLDSNFVDFYNKNLPLYENIVDTVYSNVKDMNLTEALDDYYGMPVNSYNIIVAPMLHSGGYGPRVQGENGLYDVYGIIGPTSTTKNANGEVLPEFSADTINYLVWHEFSHSFVNPTTEKYRNELYKYSNLYSNVRKQMESQAYPDWITCVNEHIVRAVTTRLIYLNNGEAAGDQALANERASGFYYIDALCESLKVYEQNKDIYPTFESYYEELIKVFKELSEGNNQTPISFNGPINSAFGYFNLDTIFIIPTNEKSSSTKEEIKLYAKIIQKQFFKDAEIITDVDALERDLGNYCILAYGTLEGNLWLKEYKDTFPFQVNSEKIIADKEYSDDNLVLISALPNPQNIHNPLVIYTGKLAEDIVDINSVFHGPTDYIIAKGKEAISSGYYKKDNGTWNFTK